MAIETDLHARFCRNVRARRRELGLTQVQLAERLGVKQPTIALIEQGRACPGLDVVERIARALDISPEALLMFDPTPVLEKTA